MHFWIKLFGIGSFSVRFTSVLFSSCTAIIIFLVGKKHFSLQSALTASLLFTASSVQMFYAHDARVYSLFVLLTAYSLYYFLETISVQENKNKTPMVLLTVINVLLCYSHFFGFVVIATEIFLCLILVTLRKNFIKLLLSTGIVVVCYAWYIPIVFQRFIASSGGTWVPKPLLTDLYTMLWRFSNVPVVTVFFLIILFYGCLFKWKSNNNSSNNVFKILLLFFTVCYFGLFVISFIMPVFIDRYLLFTSIFYYLLVAVSLSSITKTSKYSYLLSSISVILMFATLDITKGKKANPKALVEDIRSNFIQPINIIITPEWSDLNFVYYYDRKWFTYTEHLRDTLASHSIFPVNNPNSLFSLNLNNATILIDDNSHNDSLKNFLNERFDFKGEKDFGNGLKYIAYSVKK